MKCIKCETEMLKSRLSIGSIIVTTEVYDQGLMPKTKRSPVSCYLCPKCGYIELNADKPQNIQNNK